LPRLENAARAPASAGDKPRTVEPAERTLPRPDETAPVVPSVPSAAKPVVRHEKAEEETAASVRVPAEKLDTLLARVGEVRVARRRVQSRLADLVTLQDFVEHWRTEWGRVERILDKALPGEDGDSVAGLPRQAALLLRRTGGNLRRLHKDL